MANHMRTSSSGENTPEASSVDMKNISTLHAGQGAQIPQSPRQADNIPEPPNRKSVIILVVAAIVALTALFFIVRCATSTKDESTNQQPKQTQSAYADEKQQDEQTVDGSVTFQGIKYSLEKQSDGKTAVVRTSDSGTKSVLFEVEGTPTSLILFNGTILVPENRESGWDVVACALVDGSLPTLIADKDGKTVGGNGTITAATLDGTTLKVTDFTGNTTSVALQ